MDFKTYLSDSRQLIRDHLSSYLDSKKREKVPQLFKEQKLLEALEEFVLKGKLLRGSLFLFTVEGLDGKIDKTCLDIACAIELMHSALLMQDDVIDNDELRRGSKTIYSKYEEEGKKIGAIDPYHYGVSTAIVEADIAFFLALDLISSYKKGNLSDLVSYYAREVYLVALAESADSLFGQTKRIPKKDEIYDIYKYKTARYTFSLPFEMGAIVSGGSLETRTKLKELGELVGIIFQLKDDEIGIFGTEESIGKPVGSDIREDKKTIIRFYLYSLANEKDLEILNQCFGNSNADVNEVGEIKKLYEKYKIKEMIGNEVGEIMKKAWAIYEDVHLNFEHKKILKELLEFNLQRSS